MRLSRILYALSVALCLVGVLLAAAGHPVITAWLIAPAGAAFLTAFVLQFTKEAE